MKISHKVVIKDINVEIGKKIKMALIEKRYKEADAYSDNTYTNHKENLYSIYSN